MRMLIMHKAEASCPPQMLSNNGQPMQDLDDDDEPDATTSDIARPEQAGLPDRIGFLGAGKVCGESCISNPVAWHGSVPSSKGHLPFLPAASVVKRHLG